MTSTDRPASVDTTIDTQQRHHDLDALRAWAMLLGIALHASMSFFTVPWMVQDSQRAEILGLLFSLIHGFRMPLFFIVSGYFTTLSLQRRGLSAVIRQRAARILFPCLLGLFTIVPLTAFVSGRAISQATVSQKPPDITTLAGAIRLGNSKAISSLVEVPDEINKSDEVFGITPLHWAALKGESGLVELLIEKGADVNLGNRDGNRPLHAAAFVGRSDIVELLLNRGALVDSVNDNGEHPWRSTEVDRETTLYILDLLDIPHPEWELITSGRAEVRSQLAPMIESTPVLNPGVARDSTARESTTGESPAPASNLLSRIRESYQRWLYSDRWTLTIGGFSIHLFATDVFAHLWFLWMLCWLITAFVIVARATETISQTGRALLRTDATIFVLILMSVIPQWLMGTHELQFGPDTSTGLIPHPHLLLYYGLYFAAGVLLFRAGSADRLIPLPWWLQVCIAVGAFFIWIVGYESHAVAVSSQVIYTWSMSFGTIQFFRKFLATPRPFIRYISDSSYWLYIAHLPLVIELQSLIRNWSANALIKFLLISSLSILLLLLSYHLFVRSTWIGLLLNGRRHGKTRHLVSRVASRAVTES